jgi:hypothetical protein
VGIAAHIARLRAVVGHELLLLPSVSVLPAYVTAVYEARITEGSPAPADGELSDVDWVAPEDLPGLKLSQFTRALLHATGYL